MSELTPHWAEYFQEGDRCLATIRHKTDGSQNIIDAPIIVTNNYHNERIIQATMADGKGLYEIPYNELKSHPTPAATPEGETPKGWLAIFKDEPEYIEYLKWRGFGLKQGEDVRKEAVDIEHDRQVAELAMAYMHEYCIDEGGQARNHCDIENKMNAYLNKHYPLTENKASGIDKEEETEIRLDRYSLPKDGAFVEFMVNGEWITGYFTEGDEEYVFTKGTEDVGEPYFAWVNVEKWKYKNATDQPSEPSSIPVVDGNEYFISDDKWNYGKIIADSISKSYDYEKEKPSAEPRHGFRDGWKQAAVFYLSMFRSNQNKKSNAVWQYDEEEPERWLNMQIMLKMVNELPDPMLNGSPHPVIFIGDAKYIAKEYAARQHLKSNEVVDYEKEDKIIMNIVNQLFDLAEVPVEKRQSINDIADKFIKDNFFVSYKPESVEGKDCLCSCWDCDFCGPKMLDQSAHIRARQMYHPSAQFTESLRKEPVQTIHALAMRYLQENDLIELRDKLIACTPSDTNCKVKELVEYIDKNDATSANEFAEGWRSASRTIKGKANSLIQQDK